MKTKALLLTVLLMLSIPITAFTQDEEEEITLTTYYPAPYGDYDMISLTPSAQPAVADSYEGLIYFDAADSELKVYAEDPDVPNTFKWTSIGGGGASLWQADGTNVYYNDGNVGIGTDTPSTALEVAGLINAGLGSGETHTGSNTAMGVRFYSKGANTTTPNLVHPAGRIFGHNINNGWSNQALTLGVADGWSRFKDTLMLLGNGKVYVGENFPAAMSGNATLNVGGDVFSSGNVYANSITGPNGGKIITRNGHRITIEWQHPPGNLIFHVDKDENPTGTLSKTFVIDHPVDQSKYLVHATLEGPEGAVYYRGTASLENGITEVMLPDYFETLTRDNGRTIILTNVDGFDRLMIKKINGNQINNGTFTVISDRPDSNQEFNWEVKAMRADIPTLIVEPSKDDVELKGDGPYTYLVSKE